MSIGVHVDSLRRLLLEVTLAVDLLDDLLVLVLDLLYLAFEVLELLVQEHDLLCAVFVLGIVSSVQHLPLLGCPRR